MNVSLMPELEEIVARQLRFGNYANLDEVVAAGLLLLDQRPFDELRRRHEQVRYDVQLAIEQSRRGEAGTFDRGEVLRRAHESIASRGEI